METTIKIVIDDTAKWVELFRKSTYIKLSKLEIFKYAVFMLEIPVHIKDSDFEYLQSKIPSFFGTYSDYIELEKDSIINLSKDDRVKKIISEAIWVWVWLKFSCDILSVSPSVFKKIERPIEWKYLDYSVIKDWKKYNIETKWTISQYHSEMKKDIINKKNDTKSRKEDNIYLEYWTITKIKDKIWDWISECIIVDDPPNEKIRIEENNYSTILESYSIFLSYILDPKYYNKFIEPILNKKQKKVKIDKDKFFWSYNFNWKIYYWEFFDYRLIREKMELIESNNLKDAFREITNIVWKTKFFIWIEEKILLAINNNDYIFLENYKETRIIKNTKETDIFLDSDWILIVKSVWWNDKKIEKVFSEWEVKKRLWMYMNYLIWNAKECWAPCRSRDLFWKPCAIKTYRGNCHYHR